LWTKPRGHRQLIDKADARFDAHPAALEAQAARKRPTKVILTTTFY
jgi:hypothetical protein